MGQVAVLYFSQNGHTRDLAERINNKFEASSISCDLIDIVSTKTPELKECRVIFIGSPLYYGMEPLLWENYIKGLPNLSGKAGFIFSTYGVAEEGKRTDSLMINNLMLYLAEKHLKVISSHGTVCEDTWPPLKKLGVSKGRPNAEDLEKFDQYIDGIISDYKIGKIERAVYDFSVKLQKNTMGNAAARLMVKSAPKIKVDQPTCTRCGLCAEGCPVGNIEISKCAVIKSDCIKCYKCEKVCLNKAIKVDWKFWDTVCDKFMKA